METLELVSQVLLEGPGEGGLKRAATQEVEAEVQHLRLAELVEEQDAKPQFPEVAATANQYLFRN